MHSSWNRVARCGVTLAAGILSLVGCGPLRPPTAVNAHTPIPASALPTSSTPPPLPPRPFSMPLNHIDPCRILGAAQRAELGFDRGPLPDPDEGSSDNSEACSFRNTHAKVGARLALVTSAGMAVWTNDPAQVAATPVVIAGFPALVLKTPTLNLACTVEVDVADGQHLDLLYRDDGAQPPAPLDQLCAGAQRVAHASVAALTRMLTSSTAPTSTTQPIG
jgi:hypothetical protein